MTASDTGGRFPQALIALAVWLSHRFSLRFRAVDERLVARAIDVTSETSANRVGRSPTPLPTNVAGGVRDRDNGHRDEGLLPIHGTQP